MAGCTRRGVALRAGGSLPRVLLFSARVRVLQWESVVRYLSLDHCAVGNINLSSEKKGTVEIVKHRASPGTAQHGDMDDGLLLVSRVFVDVLCGPWLARVLREVGSAVTQ